MAYVGCAWSIKITTTTTDPQLWPNPRNDQQRTGILRGPGLAYEAYWSVSPHHAVTKFGWLHELKGDFKTKALGLLEDLNCFPGTSRQFPRLLASPAFINHGYLVP